jgi:hypothetical protein
MSHKISPRDIVYLANIPELFGGKGWHGLGTEWADFTPEGLRKILWLHRMVPAGIQLENGQFVATGERYAISDDDGLPVGGAVGKNWFSPSNGELFELFSEALRDSDYNIVSAGTVSDREEFFIDAKGSGTKSTGKRDVAPFVGLTRSFGGIGRLSVGGHNIVMQCHNTTTQMAREIKSASNKGKEGVTSVKNTGRLNKPEVLAEIVLGLRSAYGWQDRFVARMSEAENEKLSLLDARNAAVGFAVPTGVRELSEKNSRTLNRANRIFTLFRKGAGNTGESVADFVNAITDFYTHESAGSPDSADSRGDFLVKQFLSSERGAGARVKSDFISEVFGEERVEREVVDKLASRGKWILQNSSDTAKADLIAIA